MPPHESQLESQLEWQPARHDLAWLDARRWGEALLAPLQNDQMVLLDRWFARERPAVVCRQVAGLTNSISIGVALPPAFGKLKISLVVDRAAVIYVTPPLTLCTAIASAPRNWLPWLEQLVNHTRQYQTEFSVYGSLAWQHLSAECYMTAASDVDLLWRAGDEATLRAILDLLLRWQQMSGLRLDGELLLPNGGAIAWKELAAAPQKLLVKRASGVKLQATGEVLAMLAPC